MSSLSSLFNSSAKKKGLKAEISLKDSSPVLSPAIQQEPALDFQLTSLIDEEDTGEWGLNVSESPSTGTGLGFDGENPKLGLSSIKIGLVNSSEMYVPEEIKKKGWDTKSSLLKSGATELLSSNENSAQSNLPSGTVAEDQNELASSDNRPSYRRNTFKANIKNKDMSLAESVSKSNQTANSTSQRSSTRLTSQQQVKNSQSSSTPPHLLLHQRKLQEKLKDTHEQLSSEIKSLQEQLDNIVVLPPFDVTQFISLQKPQNQNINEINQDEFRSKYHQRYKLRAPISA